VLADPQLTPASAVPAALVGALAGGLDVTLRAFGAPYAPLLAVTVALAVTAPFRPPPDATRQQATGETLAAGTPARRQAHRNGPGPG